METTHAFFGALVLLLLVQCEAGNGLPAFFKDCGSKEGQIVKVIISGCPASEAQCELKKGSTVEVEVDFKSAELIEDATAVVHGIVAGIPVPFKIPHPHACNGSLACPVKSGAVAPYKSEIIVLKGYPSVKVVVKWELKDKQGRDIFCALFKSEITS